MSDCPFCGKPRPSGSWPICDDGSGKHGHTYGGGGIGVSTATIHQSERTVVYLNPKTGEHRTPPRSDQPVPEVYARQGYIRHELDTPQAIRQFEKSTGLVHERTHYDGSYGASAERDVIGSEPPQLQNLDEAYSERTALTLSDL